MTKGKLTGPQIHSIPIPEILASSIPFPSGEDEAQYRLEVFSSNANAPIYKYSEGRDRLDWEGTSMLSPYLRFGMLSARQAAEGAIKAIETAPDVETRANAETWLNELIWRDFHLHILYHFPRARKENFNQKVINRENDPRKFAAWCEGQTGFPVVDAAMRQLVETGWMHNRGRMITASFLTKDLLVDWRWGERWFMQHLLDGDPALNNGGWQWTAGTGTDAAPYFRIFNPTSQGLKHDPHGNYIRHWLPELALVPLEFIHEPWKMPEEVQRSARCFIGKDYPAPIIDHSWARARALNVYREAY